MGAKAQSLSCVARHTLFMPLVDGADPGIFVQSGGRGDVTPNGSLLLDGGGCSSRGALANLKKW